MKTVIRHFKFKFIGILASISLLLFFWGCSSDDSSDDQDPALAGTVSGTVLAADGSAYAKISVDLVSAAGSFMESELTDIAGKYSFTEVPAGNFTLNIKAPLGSSVAGNNKAVTVAGGQVSTVDFSFEIKSRDAFVVLKPRDPFSEVRNEDGEIPTGNEPLYTPFSVSDPEAGPQSAILAPDGHHVTLNEWNMAAGTGRITCDGSTTLYNLTFSGLIPNGIYTLWNGVLKEPKDPENSLSFSTSFAGLGALKGPAFNSFMATSDGEAEIELSVEPGSMSMFGEQPPCAITGAKGIILVVDYHIDQQTHGVSPGPDHLDVAHLLIYY